MLVIVAVISTWIGVIITLIFGALYDLLMSSLDALINILCIVCRFTCYDSLYYKTFGKFEQCCLNICTCNQTTKFRVFSHSIDQRSTTRPQPSFNTTNTTNTKNTTNHNGDTQTQTTQQNTHRYIHTHRETPTQTFVQPQQQLSPTNAFSSRHTQETRRDSETV